MQEIEQKDDDIFEILLKEAERENDISNNSINQWIQNAIETFMLYTGQARGEVERVIDGKPHKITLERL